MNLERVNTIYFLGVGGIGMSALARYFTAKGYLVIGYDRVSSSLTTELEKEGVVIEYGDDCSLVQRLDVAHTLVVRTPAVPETQPQYQWLREHGFTIMKRAEVLGWLTRMAKSLCVAGTHGKTTTSTMIAHLLHNSSVKCNAFLGGILRSFESLNALSLVFYKDNFITFLLTGLTDLFFDAMMISLPLVGTLFLISVTMGILSKAAPQMNLLSEGLPMTILTSFLILVLLMPVMCDFFTRSFDTAFFKLDLLVVKC